MRVTMWPYSIRLKMVQIGITFFIFLCIYLLYTSSSFVRHQKDYVIGDTKNHPKASFKKLNVNFKKNNALSNMEEVDMKKLLITMIKAAELGGHQVYNVRRKSSRLGVRTKGRTKEGVSDPLTDADLRSHHIMVHGLSATFPGLRIISEENHSEMDDEKIFSIKPIQINHQGIHFDPEIRELPDLHVGYGDIVVWIDPLDATKEYTENLTQYVTTMLCLAVNGVPKIGIIHKPFTHETYWAWAGHGVSKSLKELVNNRTMSEDKDADLMRFIVSRSHAGNVKKVASAAFGDKISILPSGGSGYKSIELIGGNVDAYVHVTQIKKWDICAPNAILDAVGGKMSTLRGETILYNYDDSVIINNGLLATMKKDHQEMAKILSESLIKSN